MDRQKIKLSIHYCEFVQPKHNTFLSALEAICSGFDIILNQFFADGNWVELTDNQVAFFDEWTLLTADEKELIWQIVQEFERDH